MKKNYSLIYVFLFSLFLLAGCFSSDDSSGGISNEGSKTSPVVLTVGDPHSGSVHGYIEPYESYYKYTLSGTADVTISITSLSVAQNLEIDYYGTDSTFNVPDNIINNIGTSTTGESYTILGQTANTYYFAIYNDDVDGVTYTLTVTAAK